MNIPSIFNDVIGPVMRGPSSSHSAAAVRIGRIARDVMGGGLTEVVTSFDLSGSLPTTYISQGSDMGLCGGLLGFDAADERLIDYKRELQNAGLKVAYIMDNLGDQHPNTYNLALKNGREQHSLVAISTGGGMIEVTRIDDLPISFFGDNYGLAVWTGAGREGIREMLEGIGCKVTCGNTTGQSLIFATRPLPFQTDLLHQIEAEYGVDHIRILLPVLPILTAPEMSVPFSSAEEMMRVAGGDKSLADLALRYEAARGNIAESEVLARMLEIVEILENSVKTGLAGTEYGDRILGYQSGKYQRAHEEKKLLGLGVLDRVIPYVTALMEAKSAMGVIIAAPTAGSCGGLPGTVLGVADELQLSQEEKARGLLAAGLIGALIATRSTFSAEICGCQAECGVSSGMTAAAMVTMLGGTALTAMGAASMALQNVFGMVCDPVAGRVEVPCLGKNILAASNGVSCANLALAGFDQVIPFDETVAAMDNVGRALPHELRCTARGGLSLTPTSKRIEQALASNACLSEPE
ncbi:L-serine ammonia-lyase, iron-sulfur-dependent, subunit alpha [Desulfopila aestuarii]|uniref:L-serine ammonia-lyase n=1 Tax=Desulfopila aestuarii DSM 18488 TaxID=1121416 RepID=A0A1M7YIH3_9BACT|nr:L-serine ammonia-lyase, iron-sulfur-dependent, subunit alpha [Desulfopila aestuarii]SHO52422.1 L-serine dehydratase [Desulfopila aestuarii DSM 18488]